MNRVNLTSKIVTVLMLFCGAAQAMKPGSPGRELPAHDKYITIERQLSWHVSDNYLGTILRGT